jgi:glycosyltransferase involved in cell wall biosynthesis
MKILFVITTLDVGGAEKHLLWLCQGLIAAGARCEVVYLKGEGTLAPRFMELGVPASKIGFERPAQVVAAVHGIARKIRQGRFDVVHSHLLKADALTAIAARFAHPKVLIASKHNEEPALKRRAVGLVHGALSRACHRVIALSDYVKEYVVARGGVPREKMRRIYYGIDATRFAGGDRAKVRRELAVAETTSVGLCVARFHPQKDHPTLLRTVDRLRREGRDVQLWLAGGDPFYGHRERLEARVAEMGLENHVRFLGIRDDVKDLLAGADLFVLPSLYEGLGLVYLEAMAAGRPVLATNGSAIPEVVEDGVTGDLVDVGDDAALARAWARLVDEPARGARYGEAGERRVARVFALPRMIEETLAVYRESGAS